MGTILNALSTFFLGLREKMAYPTERNFRKGDIVKDNNGNLYIFSCYSLVEGYGILQDELERVHLVRLDLLTKVI